ncbi:serine/threonine protein phosphatase 1 [Bradyrhizobium yuanmingense]|uniref:metallophosphoesterase family protein n=1 Tax=Bradyrhizobium yuanmingense TaxID=108015 RepID=UPI001F0B4AE6|nr:metallophosphoesterase family protein [Bradyrhizobium yuanmingense]
MNERMTFAIGDIHGCFEELRSLLEICRSDAGAIGHDFLFLGDYVDRGPASDQVITYLMREQASAPSQFRCLMGNHDNMLCCAADQSRSDAELIEWWANGGEETLDAYGIDDPSDLPVEHLAWMRALALHVRDKHRLFVHAGVRPGIPLEAQSKDDMLWIREPFLSSRLWHGALVVHGHTPTATRAPDVEANRVNLDTGAVSGDLLRLQRLVRYSQRPCFFSTATA